MPTDRALRLVRGAIAIALLLAACDEPDPPPFAPGRDGDVERPDGSLVVRIDGGQDGAVETLDGAIGSDAETGDASGPTVPNIDGVIGEAEWEGALVAENPTPAVTLPDRLTRLLVRRTPARLYVAIEGEVGEGRGMLLLLDANYGDDFGAVLNGVSLADQNGILDSALSNAVFSTLDPELRPDYAWGALGIPFEIDGADDAAGWREIASRSDDFLVIETANRTACSVLACETSIAIGAAGIDGAGQIAIAVRSGSEVGLLSNQTLPMDLPSSPESISALLLVPAPTDP